MKIKLSLLALCMTATCGLPATQCLAAGDNDVMPPPGESQDSSSSGQAADTQEKAPNLSKELQGSGKSGQQVEVYSYQRKDGSLVQEYSLHGKVYMVKIQPPGGLPPYYLYDDTGNGDFHRLPGGYKHISPPQWIIKRF